MVKHMFVLRNNKLLAQAYNKLLGSYQVLFRLIKGEENEIYCSNRDMVLYYKYFPLLPIHKYTYTYMYIYIHLYIYTYIHTYLLVIISCRFESHTNSNLLVEGT